MTTIVATQPSVTETTLASQSPAASPTTAKPRVHALDALRGIAVALMLLVNNPGIHDAMPAQLRHPAWFGFRLADLVFPLFLFSVGISMTLSARFRLVRPMVRRVLLLWAIGCVLVTAKYGNLSLSGGTLQFIAGSSLLAWLVARSLPPAARRAYVVLVPSLVLVGFTAIHTSTIQPGFQPGTNFANGVDRMLMGTPGELGLVGMVTASAFVLAAAELGRRLFAVAPAARTRILANVAGLTIPFGLILSTWVPFNKRIWTPSYLVVSFGLSCMALAALLRALDLRHPHADDGAPTQDRPSPWARPFVVLGANALTVYAVTTFAAATVLVPARTMVVAHLQAAFGDTVAAMGWALVVLAVGLAIAAELYRRGRFVRL